jgi:hypothetical protein
MRLLVKNTIDITDIAPIINLQQNGAIHDFETIRKIPSFQRVMEIIEQNIPEKPIWSAPSYFRIENRKKGHPPHYDGCTLDMQPNHMNWCRYSTIVGLSPDWIGGTLVFENPHQEINKEIYRSALIYSSAIDNDPQLHYRTQQNGDRYVLLIFLATERN